MRRRSQRVYEAPNVGDEDRTHALSGLTDKMLEAVQSTISDDDTVEFIFELLAECGVDDKHIHWALNELLDFDEFEYGEGEF